MPCLSSTIENTHRNYIIHLISVVALLYVANNILPILHSVPLSIAIYTFNVNGKMIEEQPCNIPPHTQRHWGYIFNLIFSSVKQFPSMCCSIHTKIFISSFFCTLRICVSSSLHKPNTIHKSLLCRLQGNCIEQSASPSIS